MHFHPENCLPEFNELADYEQDARPGFVLSHCVKSREATSFIIFLLIELLPSGCLPFVCVAPLEQKKQRLCSYMKPCSCLANIVATARFAKLQGNLIKKLYARFIVQLK